MTYGLLIVDDNPSLANLYQIVFERTGCRVRRAGGGQEALDSLHTEMADVVLLDIMMPDMDGLEVCRHIRATWPDNPPAIAVYTANTRPEIRERCLEAGADVFLTKNLSIFDLPQRLAEMLPFLVGE